MEDIRTFGSTKLADEEKLILMRAVKEGDPTTIESLLTAGVAEVNFQNHHGDTALILASWYGHVQIARLLLSASASPNLVNCDGNSALNCAAYRGSMDLVMLLLSHDATVIDCSDVVTGKTALIKAAYAGHVEVVEALLRAGASKDAADAQGYTALAFAASFNHLAVVQALLVGGADPDVQDEFGITPLIHCAARGYIGPVEALLRAGAKGTLKDSEGKTALDYAEGAEHVEIVAELRKHRESTKSDQSPVASTWVQPRDIGAASRLTPRVPVAVPAAQTQRGTTPRTPVVQSRSLAHASGTTSSTGDEHKHVTAVQVAVVDPQTMLYLSKKLVLLSQLLEHETISQDVSYPGFCC
mmetsp:Transcript_22771/g.37718  ORF Transcript_22771/g.37718 Transcript_22771/m.37718 type:complete len:356 (+) Transcript_22771:59-1126(+)